MELIRLIYTFSGKEKDLSTDVLTHPDRYVHLFSLIYILVNCILLFYVGYKIYKIRGPDKNGLSVALLLQSGFLIFFNLLAVIPNPAPETFLSWGVLLFVLLCFEFIHDEDQAVSRKLKYGLKFGLISAFLLVTKITSLPLVALPFILLFNWKNWLVYLVSTCGFAFLFLIPALSKIKFFFVWTNKLIFHAGIYGGGEEKIVDAAAFKEGLKNIFTTDILFGIIFFILVFCLALYFISNLKRKENIFSLWKSNSNFRLAVGLFVSIAGCIFIVAKHFSFHYLVPGYSLTMLAFYSGTRLTLSSDNKISKMLSSTGLSLAIVTSSILLYSFLDFKDYYFFANYSNPRMETAKEMENYKDVPKLFVTYEYYSSQVEPALYFGLCYCGGMKSNYIPILDQKYARTYFYSYPENIFHAWSEQKLDWNSIVSENEKMLISFYYKDDEVIRNTLNILNEVNQYGRVVEIKKVYENPISGEELFLLNRIGNINFTQDSARVIECDAENSSGGSLLSNDLKYNLQGLECQTEKYFHTGKKAVELTKQNAFAFGLKLIVYKKKHYEISVWRKSDSGKGVVSAAGTNFLVSSGTAVEKGSDGWEKIEIKFQLPESFTDPSISVFVWNENGDQKTYFDDLKIVEY